MAERLGDYAKFHWDSSVKSNDPEVYIVLFPKFPEKFSFFS